MSDGTTLVCPECDSAQLRIRQTQKEMGGDSQTEYACRDCSAFFDDPIHRTAESPNTAPRNGLALKLHQASPDAVSGILSQGEDS